MASPLTQRLSLFLQVLIYMYMVPRQALLQMRCKASCCRIIRGVSTSYTCLVLLPPLGRCWMQPPARHLRGEDVGENKRSEGEERMALKRE